MERHITLPLTEELARTLHAGDTVYLTGTIYTSRDAGHKRMCEALARGEELPFDPKDATIYYVGPTPAKPGQVIGSAGPTTSGRMDAYAPTMMSVGARGMIGKGARLPEVVEAMKKYSGVYFGAIGGAGALLAKCIKKAELVAYEDLQSEALRRLYVEEMPLVVCCDLDLPDGSGMDFLDEVRAADKELPFILASCHDKDDYEQEAMRRGATLCMDKMKGLLLQDKLVEYAYRQLSGEKAPTFHKLLFVHAEDTNAGVLRAAMLQKGFDLILVPSIGEAKRRIFEDKEIDLILCDVELTDGTAMELFHTLRRVAGMFQMKNPPVRLLPFFILTENNDLATEYEYRHEGVNDYITAPVNIPELIRRVLFFVE